MHVVKDQRMHIYYPKMVGFCCEHGLYWIFRHLKSLLYLLLFRSYYPIFNIFVHNII